MPQLLQSMGVALGLASLSGLNLYLTVFVTGLAIQQQWVDISQSNPELAVLAHPAVLIVSGVLFLLQFFADKVPWVDSIWDAVHTFIRPVGGALLALRALGQMDAPMEVIAALLAGSATLAMHSMKASTRLVANHSPEPFSNIALSLSEDAVVIGGLFLIKHDPVIAFIVFSLLLLAIAYIGPKVYRGAKVQLWLIWKKISSPPSDRLVKRLSADLSPEMEIALHSVTLERDPVLWAAPCISCSARGIPGNLFGFLVATTPSKPRVVFVAKRGWANAGVELDLTGYKVTQLPRFLSEDVVLQHPEKKPKYVFIFARSQRAVAEAVVASLEERLATALPPAQEEQPAIETAEPAPADTSEPTSEEEPKLSDAPL